MTKAFFNNKNTVGGYHSTCFQIILQNQGNQNSMALALLPNYTFVLELFRISFCLSYCSNKLTRVSASKLSTCHQVCFLKYPSEYVYTAQMFPCLPWIPNSSWLLKLFTARLHPNCAVFLCSLSPAHQFHLCFIGAAAVDATLICHSTIILTRAPLFSFQNAFCHIVRLS